jgi:hypothetical protein
MGFSHSTLLDKSLRSFLEEAASPRPAPASGSIAALVGALAASMGEMAIGVTARRRHHHEEQQALDSDVEALGNLRDRFSALMVRDDLAVRSWIEGGKQPYDEEMTACSREAVELSLRLVEHIVGFYPGCAPALRHEALTAAIFAEAVARVARASVESPLSSRDGGGPVDDVSDEQTRRVIARVSALEERWSPSAGPAFSNNER